MLKVGIVTLFDENYNYGGQLQAYAMCKLFSNLHLDAQIISFCYDSKKYFIQRIKALGVRGALASLRNKVIFKWKMSKQDSQFRKEYDTKMINYKQFMELIPHTSTFRNFDIQNADKLFDCFVCGSDQVWNPGWWNDIYFLGFTEKPKFSYAASIARESLNGEEKKYIREMTRNYVGIGVRELKAKEILSNVVDPEVSVVLDPTMMLEKQVWDELAIMPMIAEKYILIYKIGSVTNIVETVYKACKQAGYMVISIGYAQNTYNDNEEKISDITISSAGPREWIGWIKNAEYVFTDSFHGSAFSIIFNKDFWCFEKNKSSSTNENSRLYSLMQIFGLEDRLLSEDSMIAALLFEKKINYAEVMHTYGVEKKFSLDYINACLETIGKRVKSGYE